MRVLVVQHVAAEGLGVLYELLSERNWRIDIRCYGVNIPTNLKGYDALIILGGPMGAYEEERYPYLRQVKALVREASDKHLPVLGICLGAQLIAQALGAEVKPNPVKEIGWYPIELTPQGKELWTDLPETFSVFQWHGDTFTLPPGATLLARGETCGNQAFVYGDNIWAFQFHFELTPEMIANWITLYEDELLDFGGDGFAATVQRETTMQYSRMAEEQKYLLDKMEMALRV